MIRLMTAIDRINYFSDNYIKYYKKWFHPEEFFFLVHHKNYDGIVEYLRSHGFSSFEKYNVLTFGDGHNVGNQNRFKTEFINKGYRVVYSDIDERIYHPDLRNLILSFTEDFLIPTGMQIIQGSEEPPLDKARNVMEQRKWASVDITWYSKVCILNKDFKWDHGRHNKPLIFTPKENLYLFDLGRVCKDMVLENNQKSVKIYNRVTSRYKELTIDRIEKDMFAPMLSRLDPIKEDLRNKNPF